MWEKIILNLLSNALKFTFEGGVTVAVKADGPFARVTVRDTGTGIPASELPHIFERFHRVSGAMGRTIEGTGIGLALVQELVNLHRGSITVESEVSKGTTFTVTIPFGTEHLPKDKVRKVEASRSTTAEADAFVAEALRWLSDSMAQTGRGGARPPVDALDGVNRPAGARMERVLLADDNADMREYVRRLLGERYQVVTASNGSEALQSAVTDPPDLILSDVMMPGLDGFGLLKELRARAETKTIPVILLSARAGEESRVDGLGAGADDYLIKPFTARELLARVAAHLAMRKRRMEAEEGLKESQATLQSFYDSSSFLMGVVELAGDEIVTVYCNTATAEVFRCGGHLESRPERNSGIPAAIKALWVKHYRQSQAENRTVRFEYEHPRSAGACWLNASVKFLGYGPGSRPRFSFIAEDITERRRNEALLQQSNEELRRANADLEQFAYSASHDLQEPLRQVAIYSELLEKKICQQAGRQSGRVSRVLYRRRAPDGAAD